MYASKYHLRPRASSASATERSPWPATFDSTETEHAGPAFHQAGGSCSEFKLGDTLSPRAGNLGGEVVEASQYGQALPSTIDTSQVMATVNTEDFSSSTPQGSVEGRSQSPDGDTTTQPPIPSEPLSDLSNYLPFPVLEGHVNAYPRTKF